MFFNIYSVANGPNYQYYIAMNEFGGDYFNNPLFNPGSLILNATITALRSRTLDMDHDDRGLRGNFRCRLRPSGQTTFVAWAWPAHERVAARIAWLVQAAEAHRAKAGHASPFDLHMAQPYLNPSHFAAARSRAPWPSAPGAFAPL